MVFFEMSDNTTGEKGWTYAVEIHPTSHSIDWECTECGRAAEYPSGAFDVTVEGGTKYPDFLGCGEYPLLIVSENVVLAWEKAGIDSFRRFPVKIRKAIYTKLKPATAPAYFHVETTGQARIDLAASGIAVKKVCKRCGEATRSPEVVSQFKLLDGSWDGSHLFRDVRFFPHVTFCTEKIVTIARSSGLTNVAFDRMG